jgi:hypothetical protein
MVTTWEMEAGVLQILEATIHKCGEIIKSRFMDMGDLINTDACLHV